MTQVGKGRADAGLRTRPTGVPSQRTRHDDAAAVHLRAQVMALRGASPTARRALRSAFAGFLLDMYDVYVPVVALAPAIGYFQPAGMTATQETTLFYVTFAVTLLGRPVGAAVFGHLSDRWGRRRVTLVSVTGFSAANGLIAFLPGYASAGWAALGLLLALRFVAGVFLGGEYTAATPLAFEHCPPRARGLFGGVLMSAFAVSYIVASLVVLAVLELAPDQGAGSPYERWGWRVPFLLGALLGAVFLGYRRRVPESHLWQAAATVAQPVRQVLAGTAARQFRQVFVLMTGMWLTGSAVVSVLPAVLLKHLDVDAGTVTWVMLAAYACLAAALPAAGALGQSLGRRRVLLVCAAAAAIVASPLYLLVASGAVHSRAGLVGVSAALLVAAMSGWGVVTSYLVERFPTAVRSSGFGLGYSLALVVPSLFSLWMWALSHLMPHQYTQVVLLVLGAALVAVGAAMAPDTTGTDLSAHPADLSPGR